MLIESKLWGEKNESFLWFPLRDFPASSIWWQPDQRMIWLPEELEGNNCNCYRAASHATVDVLTPYFEGQILFLVKNPTSVYFPSHLQTPALKNSHRPAVIIGVFRSCCDDKFWLSNPSTSQTSGSRFGPSTAVCLGKIPWSHPSWSRLISAQVFRLGCWHLIALGWAIIRNMYSSHTWWMMFI